MPFFELTREAALIQQNCILANKTFTIYIEGAMKQGIAIKLKTEYYENTVQY